MPERAWMRSWVFSSALMAPVRAKRARPRARSGCWGRAASQMASRRAVMSSTGRSRASASAVPMPMSRSYWDRSRYGWSSGSWPTGPGRDGALLSAVGVAGWWFGGVCRSWCRVWALSRRPRGRAVCRLDPARGTEVEVEVADGETGEPAARGPYTICGYLAAPDRDREAFTAEGFYRSRDLVRARRYEGSLSYSSEGRVNDLIDRGGEKVNAEEVELLVAGHPAVAEMALVGMPDPRLDERGCAYVVPRDPQSPPTLAGICAYLEAKGLAKYKWPESLELIDALPRTQIGKVSKVTLRADISAKLEHETTPRGPAVTA